jgi:ParB/RepB/Spo0J family partition protein
MANETTHQISYSFVSKVTDKVLRKGKREIEKKNKALVKLEIVYVDPESIRPNKYNPNRQTERDFELLMRSMQEDGFTQPVVVQRSTREIVDGEHRWQVSKALGYEKIPVVYVDYTPEQMRISTFRHNRARGNEDFEAASAVLKELQELGALEWAQDSLQMSDLEINRMLEEADIAAELAAQEYSSAWEPTKFDETITDVSQSKGAANVEIAVSSAVMAHQERQQAVIERTTDPDQAFKLRQAMERDIYQVKLFFLADEAKTVRAILGNKPAENLVLICTDLLAQRQEEALESKPKKKVDKVDKPESLF